MRRFVAVASITPILMFSLSSSVPSAAAGKKSRDLILEKDIRQWLNYFSSDDFEGRSTFTEGLGLAAGYLAEQLKSFGVKPYGDNRSYFQRIRVLGVKSNNRSTVSVEAQGETRVFEIGKGISFPANVGGKRQISSDQIEFLGYGLHAPAAKHDDYSGKEVRGKIAVWLGTLGPKDLESGARRLLMGRGRFATEEMGALATISQPVAFRMPGSGAAQGGAAPTPGQAGGQGGAAVGAGGPQPAAPPQGMMFGPAIEKADFTTVQRLDGALPPAVSGQDEFFDFLFKGQQVEYGELKKRAADREKLPGFALKGVRVTFNIDAEYTVVRTQFTRNVIGVVEGKDAALKGTYVAFGSHYDHVGYSEGEVVKTASGERRAEPKGRVKEGALQDRYWNGADDDGSGSIAMLAVAKAFATGPKPRRSLLFVWHAGEERGLYGSRYFADYPSVPVENIVAEVNMDMIGRDRDDKREEANSVYLIGSDRISTELHNIAIDANAVMPKPLKLDFEFNDPGDPEGLYYRSDHYSYAAKGIPIVFLTTGLHPDYHANTDSADKINYEKMTRITQLVYEIGLKVANLDHFPARDRKGPRAGKGSAGRLAE